MKVPIGSLIVVAMLIPVILGGTHAHYMPAVATQSSLIVGLILASPIFGIGFLFYRFVRWHRGFHRRMRNPRQ